MNTHQDRDHLPEMAEEFHRATAMERLEAEAAEMRTRRLSTITGGDEGEEPLREWELCGVHARELPEGETDEALDLCRLSIGAIPGEMALLRLPRTAAGGEGRAPAGAQRSEGRAVSQSTSTGWPTTSPPRTPRRTW